MRFTLAPATSTSSSEMLSHLIERRGGVYSPVRVACALDDSTPGYDYTEQHYVFSEATAVMICRTRGAQMISVEEAV